MSTDFSKFSKEAINEVAKKLKDTQAQFQLKYACIKNKKDTFGAHFMDSEKMGYSKDDLAKAHKNCDQQYTTKVNRQFITLIHNAMFPADSKPTPAILRLQVWASLFVIDCHSKVFMVQATRLCNLICNPGNTCGLFRGT
jgi:hypothetical protein